LVHLWDVFEAPVVASRNQEAPTQSLKAILHKNGFEHVSEMSENCNLVKCVLHLVGFLGASLGAFRLSFATLGGLWVDLGGLWGALGGHWGVLGGLWGDLGGLWGNLGGLWGDSGGLWGDLGGSWGDLGGLWGDLGGLWGDWGGFLGCLWGPWGSFSDVFVGAAKKVAPEEDF
jgi:hypothetical protein